MHNQAIFSIHPAFWKRSKYQGNLEVKFSSYIIPLYSDTVQDELVIKLTKEKPKYTVKFKITKDFPYNEGLKYRTSGETQLLERSEEKINEKGDILTVEFKLKKDVLERANAHYGFGVEDALLPGISFEIN